MPAPLTHILLVYSARSQRSTGVGNDTLHRGAGKCLRPWCWWQQGCTSACRSRELQRSLSQRDLEVHMKQTTDVVWGWQKSWWKCSCSKWGTLDPHPTGFLLRLWILHVHVKREEERDILSAVWQGFSRLGSKPKASHQMLHYMHATDFKDIMLI